MKVGDVVLVQFPFTDKENSKKRPALIVSVTSHSPRVKLVMLAMITSKVEGLRLAGDVLLADWKSSNLLHPSLVRLSKFATVDFNRIDKKLGDLGKKDFKAVSQALKRLFSDCLGSY